MFFLVALLAFINCKTHFSRKEAFEGDSSSGNEDGGSSSVSPLFKLILENINEKKSNDFEWKIK